MQPFLILYKNSKYGTHKEWVKRQRSPTNMDSGYLIWTGEVVVAVVLDGVGYVYSR